MEYHAVSEIFPLMQGTEYEELKKDIETNGLLEPIWVCSEGKILDGRNRYRVCQELGIAPKVRTWEGNGSALGFVVSLNLHRRHLTPSQRAAIALDALPMLEAEAKQRQATSTGGVKPQLVEKLPQAGKGKSRDQAGRLFRVSGRMVTEAAKVKEKAPEEYAKVRTGTKTLQEAKRGIRQKERAAVKPQPLPSGKFAVLYADPPWRYEFSKSSSREIANQYPTLSLEEIKNYKDEKGRPIQELPANDAVLFLWVPPPKLLEGVEVLQSWGFTYVTNAVWDKEKIGMGYYFRQQHELLLVGKRGNLPVPEESNRRSSVFTAPRGKHSEKPKEVYEALEGMYPNTKKVELFSRSNRDGWKHWGTVYATGSTSD